MGESLNQYLELEGCRVAWRRTGQEALAGLDRLMPDLVICGIRLPDISGEDVFRHVASDAKAPPFLFMTAYGQIDQAVALIRAGGGDYGTKPFKLDDLVARARALVMRRPATTTGALGVSQAMRRLATVNSRVSLRSTPVLFSGETGAGKEICARHLYKDWPTLIEASVYSAQLALAAKYQGKYETVHRALMGIRGHGIGRDKMAEVVRASGVNRDLAAHAADIEALLKRNLAQADALGLRRTPTYLVGPFMTSTLDYAGFK